MKLAVLGATGSIGLQTLDVVRSCLPNAQVVALSGYSNMAALATLVEEFAPQVVWVPDGAAASSLLERCKFSGEVLTGEDGLISCATETNADIVVNALVGRAGLAPTLAAISAGKDIALANKETLVSAGELVMGLAREKGVRVTPIDSEHSAIWQCIGGACLGLGASAEGASACPAPTSGSSRRTSLALYSCVGNSPTGLASRVKGDAPAGQGVEKRVEKILLTASGGPFRGWERARISGAKAVDALKHPNWDMGAKITVDSATLMNKGLELIEAMHLFGQPPEAIEVLVHPQSIVHSMVQFCDGSVVAQMGLPDMRLPILYALSAPSRVKTEFPRLDFLKCGALTFEPPDVQKFPCLSLAIHAAKVGGTLPAVMNYINEWAVGEFLQDRISFYGISEIMDKAFGIYNVRSVTSLHDIREAEGWAQEFILNGE